MSNEERGCQCEPRDHKPGCPWVESCETGCCESRMEEPSAEKAGA